MANTRQAKIETLVSSIMARFQTVRGIRTNENSHQAHYPGDTFFQTVAPLVGKKVHWGEPEPGTF